MNSEIAEALVHPKGKYFICMGEPNEGHFLLHKTYDEGWVSLGAPTSGVTRYNPDGSVKYVLKPTTIWYFDSLEEAITQLKRSAMDWRREESIYKVARNGLKRVRCGKTLKNDWEK